MCQWGLGCRSPGVFSPCSTFQPLEQKKTPSAIAELPGKLEKKIPQCRGRGAAGETMGRFAMQEWAGELVLCIQLLVDSCECSIPRRPHWQYPRAPRSMRPQTGDQTARQQRAALKRTANRRNWSLGVQSTQRVFTYTCPFTGFMPGHAEASVAPSHWLCRIHREDAEDFAQKKK